METPKILMTVAVSLIGVVAVYLIAVSSVEPTVVEINATPYQCSSNTMVLDNSPKLYTVYKNFLELIDHSSFDFQGYLNEYPEDAVTISYIKADGLCLINIFSDTNEKDLIKRFNEFR